MGKRGPAKTPTAVLAARGSWRAKVRDGEPEASGVPVCPDWLNDDAKAVWFRLLPMLTAMSIVGSVDENALARYAQIFARWKSCEEFIAKHGQVMPVKDESGQVVGMKEFPQVGRASRLADQLLKLEQQFGMTPSARASLAIERPNKNQDNDGKARFFKPKLAG